MSRIRAINVKAQKMAETTTRDVRGYAFSDCCTSFAPGWEVGTQDQSDPCPWKSDLTLCWNTCYWMGQVPDHLSYPDWFDDCGNINSDWRNLCTVPDNG
jgi:hypothetical protein